MHARSLLGHQHQSSTIGFNPLFWNRVMIAIILENSEKQVIP